MIDHVFQSWHQILGVPWHGPVNAPLLSLLHPLPPIILSAVAQMLPSVPSPAYCCTSPPTASPPLF